MLRWAPDQILRQGASRAKLNLWCQLLSFKLKKNLIPYFCDFEFTWPLWRWQKSCLLAKNKCLPGSSFVASVSAKESQRCQWDHKATCVRLVDEVIADLIIWKHPDTFTTRKERLLVYTLDANWLVGWIKLLYAWSLVEQDSNFQGRIYLRGQEGGTEGFCSRRNQEPV